VPFFNRGHSTAKTHNFQSEIEQLLKIYTKNHLISTTQKAISSKLHQKSTHF